jgi:hypothetical protein
VRNFFENLKVVIGELVGIIGGYFWGKHTNWDYEPTILLIVSSLSFFISTILFLFRKRSNKIPVTNTSSIPHDIAISLQFADLSKPHQKQNRENLFESSVTEITPQKIKEKISEVPLFAQHDMAANFVGLHVRWVLRLAQIHKKKGTNVEVSMEPLDDTFLRIYFETNTDNYPVLKIAEDEKRFEVFGKIIKCEKFSISLELLKLIEV